MNHTVSQVIGEVIVVQAALGKWSTDPGLTRGDYQVTYETLPDTQGEGDYAIAVFDVEGENQNLRNMRTGEPTIRPGISIQVRAPTDKEASTRAWALANYLDALRCRGVTIEGSTYRVQNFSRKVPPTFLLKEDRGGRQVWVFRGYVTIYME